MTVTSSTCTVSYACNGSQTAFNFGFLIPFQADGVTPAVLVQNQSATGVLTTLVWNTDFTISGVGVAAGGTVTTEGAKSPLASGTRIVIERALNYVQDTSVPNGPTLPNVIEQVADLLAQQIQQINAELGDFLAPCTVANLPAASLANQGTRGVALDATASTFASTVVGGGTTVVPVISNGTNWIIG